MSLVREFDVYGEVLNFGNRSDMEDYRDGEEVYASWEVDEPVQNPGGGQALGAVLRVYDDNEERKFFITWEEVIL